MQAKVLITTSLSILELKKKKKKLVQTMEDEFQTSYNIQIASS